MDMKLMATSECSSRSPRACLAAEVPATEYLVTMTTRVPAGTPEQAVQAMRARESAHARELAAPGSRPQRTGGDHG